jgi:quercetin dioxygenase-like cupin family protein
MTDESGAREYLVKDRGSLWDKSPIPGSEMQLLVGAEQSLGAYSIIRGEMTESVPEHRHEHDDESIYVLEGRVTVTLAGKPYHLETGDFLFMPRKQPHAVIVDKPCRLLTVGAPGGVLDSLMVEIGNYVAAGNELTAEVYTEMQERRGITGTWLLTEEDLEHVGASASQ